MKKRNILIYAIFLFMILINNVNAASNPYKNTQTIDGVTTVPCTYFAWQQAYDNAKVALPGWGNAGTWYNSASKAGYSVGSVARANSIAVWSHKSNSFGHVAYVVSVDGDTMTVNEGGVYSYEYNEETGESTKVAYNGNGLYYNNIVPSSGNRNEDSSLIGFIYLDDAPATPVKQTTEPKKGNPKPKQETTTTPKKEEVVKTKSSNNNLSALSIKDIELEFNKDTTEYELVVAYEVEQIEVEALVEDKTAKVSLEPSYSLEVGENIITITVQAEDESSKEYILNVTRKEQVVEEIEEEKEEFKEEESSPKNTNKKVIILSSIIALVICLVIIIVVVLKKRSKGKK